MTVGRNGQPEAVPLRPVPRTRLPRLRIERLPPAPRGPVRSSQIRPAPAPPGPLAHPGPMVRTAPDLQEIDAYYSATIEDYLAWSPEMNLHFGFWKPPMPFDLRLMLEQMNVEVIERLRLDPRRPGRVADLGCGVGTVARTCQRRYPGVGVVGLTVVGRQAALAGVAAARVGEQPPPILRADFTAAPFPAGVFAGVYSIESSCYAPGVDKAPLLREMARLTRPGGRMVVADAFLKYPVPPCPVSRVAHEVVCDSWALDTFGHLGSFVAAAWDAGFEELTVEDISANVLPSSLHAPWVMLRWAIGRLVRGESLDRRRWRHALVGLPLMTLALDRSAVGYYLVSGTRRRR